MKAVTMTCIVIMQTMSESSSAYVVDRLYLASQILDMDQDLTFGLAINIS